MGLKTLVHNKDNIKYFLLSLSTSRGGASKNSCRGVPGLQLPSKECEVKLYKPKLFLNHFSHYLRRTTSNFGGQGSN